MYQDKLLRVCCLPSASQAVPVATLLTIMALHTPVAVCIRNKLDHKSEDWPGYDAVFGE